ncbi:MAG: UvrD-helicase domain-containing protein [Myxococcota bacterium]
MKTLTFDHLNDAQQEAVLHRGSPLLVLAGAGTGKTTVITYRIVSLLLHGDLAPHRILAMTFTNKAAREMRQRAAHLAGLESRLFNIGTFHGTCALLLRQHGVQLGLDRNFLIYNADDQLRLIKRCVAELGLDLQVFAPKRLRHHIEQWKNHGVTAEHVETSHLDFERIKAAEVYRLYERRCLQANAVDFGALLVHTLTLLRQFPEVKQSLRHRWRHVLVDEYQDTNPVQYHIIRELVSDEHGLTVVGDDDQSIYRWRGADIGNMLHFERDFPETRLIRLELNYRSTPTILAASNAVISHNVARKGKTLYSEKPAGSRLSLRIFANEREEGESVVVAIAEALSHGVSAAEIAVLFRTNAQSRPLEDALRRRRIAYAVYGGMRFYDRKEIRDALAYLRLLSNPLSDIDFLRIINEPARGLGKTSLARLQALALHENVSLFEAARRAAQGHGELTQKARSRFAAFVEMFSGVAEVPQDPATQADSLLRASGYLDALREQSTEEAWDRLNNIEALVQGIREYASSHPEPTLAGFLEEVSLVTDTDEMGESRREVSLMTLHAAKGLEFDVVFLVGMEEDLFPHKRSRDDRAGEEEERRLCYVGLTRARDQVHLSAARSRYRFGEQQTPRLSRFVGEIPRDLIDMTGSHTGISESAKDEYLDDTSDFSDMPISPSRGDLRRANSHVSSDTSLKKDQIGQRVRHRLFGDGTVIGCSGAGRDLKVTIDFSGKRKVVVARYVEWLG